MRGTWGPGNLKDTLLRGAFLQGAQLQGAHMGSAQLQGADLRGAQLQGADLNYANLQGADLRGAQLQGADLSHADLRGADLRWARLQGAKLEGVKLEGADVASAEVWLAALPSDIQWPPPRGLADVKTAPLPPEAQAQLKQDLIADITDVAVLQVVMPRLDEILRDEPPDWDGNSWTNYAGTAKQPSAEELARFHAKLACADSNGSIANRMAARVITERSGKAHAKVFATALLDERCEGGKALSNETRAELRSLPE
jgi:hypothetical protein